MVFVWQVFADDFGFMFISLLGGSVLVWRISVVVCCLFQGFLSMNAVLLVCVMMICGGHVLSA